MSEVARLAIMDSGLMQADHEHPPVVDSNKPNNRPHVPAPPPLNGVRQGIEERLDELDMKEREIFRERLELKSRWNRSLMVTQLPNEILFLIFVYFSGLLPSTDEDDEDYFKFGLAKIGWTKLMLVCRRWCDVARATPALWRTIDVGRTSLSWMKLALTRSSGATIDVSFPFDFEEEHASLLQPHYHRLRSFRLQSWSPTARRVIRSTLPALETLEICSNPSHKNTLKGFYTDLRITRERFPNLRTLQLVHTVVPRDPLFYAPLRKLSLKGCPFKSSLEQFVQLLSDCPRLNHLELDGFLQQLPDSGSVGPPRFLPSLVSVRLSDHVPIHSARFLSRIVIPAASLSTTANIGFDEEERGDTLRAVVPPNLRNSLPGLATLTWGRLIMTYEEYSIECHPTKPGRGETVLVELALTSSAVGWAGRMSDGLTDLLELFGSAPLTHLETLGYCTTVDVEIWAQLFRTFPSLVSLEADVDEAVFTGLLEASLASPVDGPVVCRALERVSMTDEWGVLKNVEPLLDPLIHCLLYRADRGTRLKELHLGFHGVARAAVREKYLPQLENLVSNIVFGNTFAKHDVGH
ncbi:hypothetical protein LXA43DRAFT_1026425 [Ganoderma leucocontextum]|nr:hypothetical protein LXA43DRAFT_1026425 [Ganoderma leucocontextum]